MLGFHFNLKVSGNNVKCNEFLFLYSKTCLKRPLKKKDESWFSIPIIA